MRGRVSYARHAVTGAANLTGRGGALPTQNFHAAIRERAREFKRFLPIIAKRECGAWENGDKTCAAAKTLIRDASRLPRKSPAQAASATECTSRIAASKVI